MGKLGTGADRRLDPPPTPIGYGGGSKRQVSPVKQVGVSNAKATTTQNTSCPGQRLQRK